MKKFISHLSLMGFNAKTFLSFITGLPWYFTDYLKLKKQLRDSHGKFKFKMNYPILFDKHAESGTMKGHYFHQDLLVAKRVFTEKPEKHVDIGSRIDGLIAHIACFREVEIFDIRPLKSEVSNINFHQLDFTAEIDPKFLNYCDSMSCLHALEHFGLGRYGDPIDANGYYTGFKNMTKLLESGGVFYFSVPIGKQRIEFNAHRVFNLGYLKEMVTEDFSIRNFSYVNDNGDLFQNVDHTTEEAKNNFGNSFGCAIFELVKN